MNPSDKDWVIKLALSPNEDMNGKYFFIGCKIVLIFYDLFMCISSPFLSTAKPLLVSE